MNEDPNSKTCSDCHKNKHLMFFGRRKYGRFSPQCHDCINARHRETSELYRMRKKEPVKYKSPFSLGSKM